MAGLQLSAIISVSTLSILNLRDVRCGRINDMIFSGQHSDAKVRKKFDEQRKEIEVGHARA